MKRLLALALLLVLLAVAAGPAAAQSSTQATQQNVLKLAAQQGLEVQFDLPYAGTDHPKQRVDLYLPQQRPSPGPLPVIALIHGGGWRNGDRLGYAGHALPIAATGHYAVVAVGYRLTGEAAWPAQVHDVKAALRWIRAHAAQHGLDPDRIAVWGSSAGGHLSSLLGTSGGVADLEGDLGPHTRFSSRVQCVVNLCGPQDFSLALMVDQDGQPITEDDAVMGLLGGTAVQQPAAARAASPVTHVSADDPPFITFHGTADQRVAFSHAERIHAALQKAGVPSLLVPIRDGDHGSVKAPEVRVRGLQFTDRVLRGQSVEIDLTPIAAPDPSR